MDADFAKALRAQAQFLFASPAAIDSVACVIITIDELPYSQCILRQIFGSSDEKEYYETQ